MRSTKVWSAEVLSAKSRRRRAVRLGGRRSVGASWRAATVGASGRYCSSPTRRRRSGALQVSSMTA